jgi:hypothetical protein
VDRRVLVAAIVLVPLVGYVLLALGQGAPRFPTRGECVHAPIDGQPVDVVFGRRSGPVGATELRDQVVSLGFLGVESLPDGCGRWKVVLQDVPSIEVARGVQEEATSVDLEPTLELGSGT